MVLSSGTLDLLSLLIHNSCKASGKVERIMSSKLLTPQPFVQLHLSQIQNLALLSSHAHHIATLAGERCPYAAVFRHATLHHSTVGVEYFHKRVMPGTANTKHAVTARHGGGSNGVEVGNGSGGVGTVVGNGHYPPVLYLALI